MSSRQKSFFDKDNKVNKPFRPHNPRTRSANNVPQAPQATHSPAKPAMSKPGIAPAPQTKSKLKAFQFVEGRPSSEEATAEGNKENEGLLVDQRQQAPIEQTPMKAPLNPELLEKRLPPSTPATRLPLADLIGNPEEKTGMAAMVTPEEHVLWVHAQGSASSQPAATPVRKRKRAKSSSPASSQQPEHSNFYPEIRLTDGPHKSMHTPQADPAADLWLRYASGTDGLAVDKSAAFSHLIRDPSPKSPATAGSIGGLRRWASCGIEWPQSAAKRRRVIRRVEEQIRQEKTMPEDPYKVSRVGLLLERMKETLVKPHFQIPEGPSSSSPLPERIVEQDHEHDHSPLHRLGPIHEREEESPVQQKTIQAQMNIQGGGSPPEQKPQTFDFGDDDFDDFDEDMLDAMESTAKAAQGVARPIDVPVGERDLASIASSNGQIDPPAQPELELVHEPSADTDEFGDDDDELLGMDLEAIVAQHELQPSSVQHQESAVVQGESASKCAPPPNDVHVISDDEFGDDDIDEDQFDAIEAAATQAYQGNNRVVGSSEHNERTIQRYLITAIQEKTFTDEHGRQQMEKVLLVDESRLKYSRKIMLRQSWFETPATIGSYVHVTGFFDSKGQCIIDNTSNILILHPDHLISATVVADSFGCIRRAVLQDRVKATGDASPPMMYGHILHELFQEAMKANDWTDDAFSIYMASILPQHYETMVEIGLNLNQVQEHLRSKFPEMRGWAELFVRSVPRREAVIRGRNGQQAVMAISKLLDVEEHIWSPNYGLKGNVDATVQAKINDGATARVVTVPFELKTGKRASEHHVAQTALYTLLTSDRYDIEITEGILYYLETSQITRVQAIRHELIHLIMKRNELACYVRERLKLPPMLPESRQRLCNHCYAQTTCFLYHKLAEDGTSQTIANKGKFEELVKYLQPMDQVFFKKWDMLLTKEESEMKKFTRELWTMLSKEREKRGRCFGNVVIESGSGHEILGASKINRFQYTFVKQTPIPGFSFTESQITIGEPIVISDEKGHYALANGYVTSVHKKRITVAVDRRLHNARTRRPGFDEVTNQDFVGVMEAISTQDTDPNAEPVVYRLDKDEFSNGMATARNNMLQIMDDTIFKARDLRALIVQDRTPRFKVSSTAFNLQSQAWRTEMNTDQEAAIEKVMTAQDYALVLGMPGTGKTTTIAQIIRAIVAQGKSVLLTSYTHTAVDNILLKIRGSKFDTLRLGVLAKIHPQVKEFAILAAQQKDSVEEVASAWYNSPVVATTCLGVNHPIFTKRTFDYCIVDEASQITLPVCLGPIRMAKAFILVGDHFQLPPLVQNRDALAGGLDMSLFRMLSERHPEAVVNLEHQYRMCEDIMSLSNQLIYSGRLKCGTETVANQRLNPPHINASLKRHHYSTSQHPIAGVKQVCSGESRACHISLGLEPRNRVLFFNTDPLLPLSTETVSGPRITNPYEAALTAQFVISLLDAGINASEIGVVTFYRSQLADLRQLLRGQPGVELHTADKFQGRDKEVVIVSFVRSNQDQNVGELLKDWRRINVAITRAKSKLILVGSKSTLVNGGEVLKGLVAICEKKGWVHNLTADEHVFPELATQISGTTQGASPLKAGTARLQSPKRSVKVAMSPTNNGARKVLGEVRTNRLNMKVPEKKGKVGEKGIVNKRPILRDVMNELVEDD